MPVAAQPAGATSESLLDLPGFADLAGRGVLLVKGSGGRELLREALAARGAEVLDVAVYRREAVAPTADRDRGAGSGAGRRSPRPWW